MDVMGTNWHRERLHQKKQEYHSCSEYLKDVQLSLLIYQEIYLLEMRCLPAESLNLFFTWLLVLQT